MSNQISALPHIVNLDTYVPGKPIETLAREKNLTKIIKLASNENPYGPSPLVLEAIKNNLSSISQYPDPDQYSLKHKLSEFYNINPSMLAIGNGSDELLQLIMRAFVSQDNNVIIPKYSFISYQICAKSIGARIIETAINEDWQNNLEDILEKINNKTKLICIVNPNNPTGSYINYNQLNSFLAKVPSNILIILDEAYYEFIKFNETYYNSADINKVDPAISLLQQYDNLVITRTFSKVYGLAGLRVGYSISSPNITTIINKIKQPFNVNRLAQIAAITALDDQEYIKKLAIISNNELKKLCNHLQTLKINFITPHANFITVDTNSNKNSEVIYNKLLDSGIIVRPLKNYGLDNYLRISIGTSDENQYLIQNIDNIKNLFFN